MQIADSTYVLITAARNEEGYIRRVLQSVTAQTRLPAVWVIVNDDSSDGTDEIISEFARRYDFIRPLRLTGRGSRAFSSQAFALNAGYESIKESKFDFVGFLDADISFDPGYYAELLNMFAANPRLGIAGGHLLELRSGRFSSRNGEREGCVPGAIQLFRRGCFEDVGARFVPLQYGGYDSLANALASTKGWIVRCFRNIRALHHRPTGTAGATVFRAKFIEGMQDYFLGYHVCFEAAKCLRRVTEPPFVIGSLLRFCGFLAPVLRGEQRTLSRDFVRSMRQQQAHRIVNSALGLLSTDVRTSKLWKS